MEVRVYACILLYACVTYTNKLIPTMCVYCDAALIAIVTHGAYVQATAKSSCDDDDTMSAKKRVSIECEYSRMLYFSLDCMFLYLYIYLFMFKMC